VQESPPFSAVESPGAVLHADRPAAGARFMFDSTMSHPEWPATENGKVKTDCTTDVYVVEYSGKR
jgi:hypothetical protein